MLDELRRLRPSIVAEQPAATPPGMNVRRLVVNADDFGLTPGVCPGILRGHRDGVVTSTSVLTVAPAFDDHAASLSDVRPARRAPPLPGRRGSATAQRARDSDARRLERRFPTDVAELPPQGGAPERSTRPTSSREFEAQHRLLLDGRDPADPPRCPPEPPPLARSSARAVCELARRHRIDGRSGPRVPAGRSRATGVRVLTRTLRRRIRAARRSAHRTASAGLRRRRPDGRDRIRRSIEAWTEKGASSI